MKKYQGHILDVVRREVFDGEVMVENERIKQVKRCMLPDNGKAWPYLMPGFIDSHVHIESSMMSPCEFAHVASTHGAIAGSVAHDCHNIVAIGCNDEYLAKAINRVIEMKGGQVAIADDDMADLALPIAGLMSPLGGHEVAYRCIMLSEMARRAGCTMRAPFITMAFLCLPVIPELKITDKHLWDSKNMKVVEY